MKKKNIYVNQSQELLSLFEKAGNNEKIMCVGTKHKIDAVFQTDF